VERAARREVAVADRIDVHAHYNTGVVRQHMERIGFRLKGGYVAGRWSRDGALEMMDRHGIATQLLSMPLVMTAPADEPDFMSRFARDVNDELAGLVAADPDRFGAFATIPLHDADAAIAEIARATDELQLDGVVVTSNAAGEYFGDPFWEPILAELDRRQVPVFVHPTDCPCIDVLGNGRPSSVIEFPMDTCRNITNALYTGVFVRYPGLRLILAHCGGALPSLAWRIAEHTQMGIGADDEQIDPGHVTTVLRGLYYETALAASPNSLLPTLQVTDASHILFGTDFPAAPAIAIDDNVDQFDRFGGFDETARTAVERGNAVGLFPRLA
jgi:predicted TIM-barrel fold metal-dependent hydrolase